MTATWPADWDAMVAGQDCSMCAKGRPDDDGFGIRIQAARYSDAYLQRADMQRGYRALAAARQRSGEPATPGLDPVFVALNPGALPARERSPAELHQWVRREEQYATLGANVVVELYSESHARKPTTRAWAITDEPTALTGWPTNAPAASTAATPTEPTGPINPRSGRRWPMLADP